MLRPGGVFVDAEQILGPTPWLEERQDREWEAGARRRGADDGELAPSRPRMTADRCSPVEDQLAWLRDAGFAPWTAPSGRSASPSWWAGRAPGPNLGDVVPTSTSLKSNDLCWCGSGRKYKRCHKAARGSGPARSDLTGARCRLHIPRPPYAETGVPPAGTSPT